ncbi:MAG TPA: protein kinase [Pyrinomonadaceae bacterium]|nr:protein kinase [Pyrinomonadaceae bacterium]
MKPERWQQVSRIFKSAISLDDGARSAYVVGQCGSDEALRAEVEKLLESYRKANAGNFMDGVAAEDAASLLLGENELEPEPRTLTPEQQFGSYKILDSLGSGGMGEVYRARDTRLDRIVALKVLSPGISLDKRRMQRFRQEAKVASSLNQPNILTVYEFGEVDGLTFIAAEFVDGQTLRTRLHESRLKLGEILDITIQILSALDAAHEARIVHRDIKPENVMIRRRDGLVKVLDFGLAKTTEKKVAPEAAEAATQLKTAPGIIMGTINYMSPEQAQASSIDERTDIWSTGVLLYEMVAGAMPFSGATSSHTIVQILEKHPVPLTEVARAPADLDRIVRKAMAKSPDERYQSAKDMLVDLRALKKVLDVKAEVVPSELSTAAIAVERTNEADRGRDKKRVLAGALIAMAVVTAAIFGINLWRTSRARTSPSVAAPVAVPDERTLTYWITVQKFKNNKPYQNPFTLAGEINFEASYQIRVNVRSAQPGYLYILNEGPASGPPEYNVVFPTPTANKGSSLLPASQMVRIPEKSWLQFDRQQGVEKLWLIFSAEAVTDLEQVKQFASEQTSGLITDPAQNKSIKNFLDSHATTKLEIEKGESLTTLKAPGKLLVHAIKLEHH